jgi:hypothetical protein
VIPYLAAFALGALSRSLWERWRRWEEPEPTESEWKHWTLLQYIADIQQESWRNRQADPPDPHPAFEAWLRQNVKPGA